MAVWRRSSSIAKADQLCLSRSELPVRAQARPSLSSGRFVDAMWGGRKFDGFWTAEFSGKWLICIPGNDLYGRKGEWALIDAAYRPISVLHKRWTLLENEHHELEVTMRQPGLGRAALERLRDRQARLLLEISGVVAEIRNAPATTLEDYAALLDVAIEHEIDLAGDIACYGPADFPMITRLLRALSERLPGFEFNSLQRWLSSPGEYEQVVGSPASGGNPPCESIGFGRA
jgi:hypothetical protein